MKQTTLHETKNFTFQHCFMTRDNLSRNENASSKYYLLHILLLIIQSVIFKNPSHIIWSLISFGRNILYSFLNSSTMNHWEHFYIFLFSSFFSFFFLKNTLHICLNFRVTESFLSLLEKSSFCKKVYEGSEYLR